MKFKPQIVTFLFVLILASCKKQEDPSKTAIAFYTAIINQNFEEAQKHATSSTARVMNLFTQDEKNLKKTPPPDISFIAVDLKINDNIATCKLKAIKNGNEMPSSFPVKLVKENNKWLVFMEMSQEQKDVIDYKLSLPKKNIPKKKKRSPSFENYRNYNGKTNSLSDFKGKYLYIDIWATWCAPCLKEFPFLKEMKIMYNTKNIEFISISADNESKFNKWKQIIKDKNLDWIHLFADNGFKSDFLKEYNINSIPRFILIDPEGYIISENAPRPSEIQEIIELFNSIDI